MRLRKFNEAHISKDFTKEVQELTKDYFIEYIETIGMNIVTFPEYHPTFLTVELSRMHPNTTNEDFNHNWGSIKEMINNYIELISYTYELKHVTIRNDYGAMYYLDAPFDTSDIVDKARIGYVKLHIVPEMEQLG